MAEIAILGERQWKAVCCETSPGDYNDHFNIILWKICLYFHVLKPFLGRLTLLQGALHDVLGCDRLRGNPTVDRQDLPCQPQLFRSEKIFFGKISTKAETQKCRQDNVQQYATFSNLR